MNPEAPPEIVDVVFEVQKRYGCQPKQIFRDAFRYANRIISEPRLTDYFLDWQNHGILQKKLCAKY